jgi:hypothetical protein
VFEVCPSTLTKPACQHAIPTVPPLPWESFEALLRKMVGRPSDTDPSRSLGSLEHEGFGQSGLPGDSPPGAPFSPPPGPVVSTSDERYRGRDLVLAPCPVSG